MPMCGAFRLNLFAESEQRLEPETTNVKTAEI